MARGFAPGPQRGAYSAPQTPSWVDIHPTRDSWIRHCVLCGRRVSLGLSQAQTKRNFSADNVGNFRRGLPNQGITWHKPQFCEVGFTLFNKLSERCKDHQKSSRHIECVRAEHNHRDGTAVTRMLADFKGSQGRNRKKLLTLFRAIRFLSRQGLAFGAKQILIRISLNSSAC